MNTAEPEHTRFDSTRGDTHTSVIEVKGLEHRDTVRAPVHLLGAPLPVTLIILSLPPVALPASRAFHSLSDLHLHNTRFGTSLSSPG
jgi:hypothetical protein